MAAVVLLSAIGFLIRLAAARGDLWLDEIWTFRLLEASPSLQSVLFALPNDNNHLLNSAWLALVGPAAPPLVVRLPSVVFGTLCIPVAASIGWRRHPLAGLFAAALVTFDGLLVHYSSEARGYSGLILAGFAAVTALESYIDRAHLGHRDRRMPLAGLGLAVAFGTLSQLTMIATSLVLCATLALEAWKRRPAFFRAAVAGVATIGLGTLPALICLAISMLDAPLHTGRLAAFSWPLFAMGMARLVEAVVGLPDKGFDPAAVLAVAALACGFGLMLIPARRRALPALAIFGMPALQCALHLPNEEFARFHLVTALGMVILAVDVVARSIRGGPIGRRAALALALIAIMANIANVQRFLATGRGAFSDAVAMMGRGGPATFVARPQALAAETGAVATWYAARLGVPVTVERSPCPGRAEWLLLAREPGDPLQSGDEHVAGAPGCDASYALAKAYPAYGLSGFTWLLFRRAGGNSMSDSPLSPIPVVPAAHP